MGLRNWLDWVVRLFGYSSCHHVCGCHFTTVSPHQIDTIAIPTHKQNNVQDFQRQNLRIFQKTQQHWLPSSHATDGAPTLSIRAFESFQLGASRNHLQDPRRRLPKLQYKTVRETRKGSYNYVVSFVVEVADFIGSKSNKKALRIKTTFFFIKEEGCCNFWRRRRRRRRREREIFLLILALPVHVIEKTLMLGLTKVFIKLALDMCLFNMLTHLQLCKICCNQVCNKSLPI